MIFTFYHCTIYFHIEVIITTSRFSDAYHLQYQPGRLDEGDGQLCAILAGFNCATVGFQEATVTGGLFGYGSRNVGFTMDLAYLTLS